MAEIMDDVFEDQIVPDQDDPVLDDSMISSLEKRKDRFGRNGESPSGYEEHVAPVQFEQSVQVRHFLFVY